MILISLQLDASGNYIQNYPTVATPLFRTGNDFLSKIRKMCRFLKTRWLIRQLRRDCFNGVKDGNIGSIIAGETWMKRYIFVDFNAENCHFLWWRIGKRDIEGRKKMAETLNSIIDECISNGWIIPKEDQNLPADERRLIKTTGIGDGIGDPYNTFVDFCEKYRIFGALIWAVAVYITTQIPPIKDWLINLTSPISPWW